MKFARLVSIFIWFFYYGCAGDLDSQKNTSNNQKKVSNNVCLQYLSAADVNRTNSLYQECVDAYNIVVSPGKK